MSETYSEILIAASPTPAAGTPAAAAATASATTIAAATAASTTAWASTATSTATTFAWRTRLVYDHAAAHEVVPVERLNSAAGVVITIHFDEAKPARLT